MSRAIAALFRRSAAEAPWQHAPDDDDTRLMKPSSPPPPVARRDSANAPPAGARPAVVPRHPVLKRQPVPQQLALDLRRR